jgi:hypothetical protein
MLIKSRPVDFADQHEALDPALDQHARAFLLAGEVVFAGSDEQRITMLTQFLLQPFDEPA